MIRKIILFSAILIISVVTLFAQDKLQVSERDMTGVIFREAGDNETVVEIKSNVKLEFESTMDKAVNAYRTYEESGFFFYNLLFSTDKKYKGRKLKIKSFGFDTYTQSLDLKSKIPVGLFVIDPNGEVGVGCYFEHLNKGNKFFENTQYADAKTEYYLALECSDVPEGNDLSKKIDDAGTALDSKRDADDYYNAGKLENALREYEKVYAINPKDSYAKERITLCNGKIAILPRTIRGKVTASEDGKALADVSIKAEYYKVDKKGKVKVNKNGVPETEWKDVGKTDYGGNFEITVLNQTKNLKFYKRTEESLDGSRNSSVGTYNGNRDNPSTNTSTASAIVEGLGVLAKTVAKTMKYHYSGKVVITSDEINIALAKKAGF